MIIGHGLVAKAFPFFADCPDILIFASGVSNSGETDAAAFGREKELLQSHLKNGRKIVYFSTCSLFDPALTKAPYIGHKKEMEELVGKAKSFAIFRLPQVVGNTPNRHTLTNFLYQKIKDGSPFEVWKNATRNIIDIDDVAVIVKECLSREKDNQTANIACPTSTPILELVAIFEKVLGKKADYSVVDAGGSYDIDSKNMQQIAARLGIRFGDAYAESVIRKYYAEGKPG